MDDKRFQEIKGVLWIVTEEGIGLSLSPAEAKEYQELIAAYEQAQAELADANECCNRLTHYFEVSEDWKERCHDRKNLMKIEKDRHDLRKQLADERKWTIKYREAIIEDKAMQAEIERRGVLIDQLREGLMGEKIE